MLNMEFNETFGRPIYTPPGGPPPVDRPNPEIYSVMGSENLFKLIEDFYLELGKSSIREMFPEDLVAASKKQAMFFIGLCGGPPLYAEAFGHPRLRARHLPFRIDEAARQEWLRCFRVVLDRAEDYQFPAEHVEGFWTFVDGFSSWMVNHKKE
jgi:hemoglobin